MWYVVISDTNIYTDNVQFQGWESIALQSATNLLRCLQFNWIPPSCTWWVSPPLDLVSMELHATGFRSIQLGLRLLYPCPLSFEHNGSPSLFLISTVGSVGIGCCSRRGVVFSERTQSFKRFWKKIQIQQIIRVLTSATILLEQS